MDAHALDWASPTPLTPQGSGFEGLDSSSGLGVGRQRTWTTENEEESVSIRPLPSAPGSATLREVRVSCPDATGLACDFARLLLDAGLRVLAGDVSTDGRWCFMVFTVAHASPTPAGGLAAAAAAAEATAPPPPPPPRWAALKVRLDACCASAAAGAARRRVDFYATGGVRLPPPRGATTSDGECGGGGGGWGRDVFLVTLTAPGSADRRGLLRDAVAALGAADLTVVRVAAGDAPGGVPGSASAHHAPAISDRFWVLDGHSGGGSAAGSAGRGGGGWWAPPRGDDGPGGADAGACPPLPSPRRVAAVVAAVRSAVGGGGEGVDVTVEPAPDEGGGSGDGSGGGSGDGGSGASAASTAALAPPPAPSSSHSSPPRATPAARRRACVDAAAASPLRHVARRGGLASAAGAAPPPAGAAAPPPPPLPADHRPPPGATPDEEEEEEEEFDWHAPLSVCLDNRAAPSHTLVTVTCPDRKGLVYDLFSTVKDVGLDVAYARIAVEAGTAGADLFVRDEGAASGFGCGGGAYGALPPPPLLGAAVGDGGGGGGAAGAAPAVVPPPPPPSTRIEDEDLAAELVRRVRAAARLPVKIRVRGVEGGPPPPAPQLLELEVTAPLDSGGRGRPKVTADVTAALAAAGLDVRSADVFVEAGGWAGGGRGGGGQGGGHHHLPPRPPAAREVHRFTVASSGQQAWTDEVRRAVYDCVREALTGVPRGAGGGPAPSAGGGGEAGGGRAPAARPPSSPPSLAAQPLLGVRSGPVPVSGRPPVHPATAARGADAPSPASSTRALLQEWGRWAR